eukprot:c10026_g1_i2.p1 GENE.c10026_g1_i2~~c10026_g1_i2.p1  ORF type:complete len:288 (-),score=56.91 c10026_g1_i2:475-1260(-)
MPDAAQKSPQLGPAISPPSFLLDLSFHTESWQGRKLHLEDRHVNAETLAHDIIAFALYDGHGGVKCAEFLGKHLLKNISESIRKYLHAHPNTTLTTVTLKKCVKDAFAKTDSDFLENARMKSLEDGSTALIVLIADGIQDVLDEDSTQTPSPTHTPPTNRKLIIVNLGDSRAVCCRSGRPLRYAILRNFLSRIPFFVFISPSSCVMCDVIYISVCFFSVYLFFIYLHIDGSPFHTISVFLTITNPIDGMNVEESRRRAGTW